MGETDRMTVRIVAGDGDDAADLALLTRRLRSSLTELNVRDVRPAAEETPDGAKSGATEVLGWLWVSVGGESIMAVVRRVADLTVSSGREIEVTLNGQTLYLKRATREQQELAFREWLARVNGAGGELPPAEQPDRGYL
jgi:hypothetical protein